MNLEIIQKKKPNPQSTDQFDGEKSRQFGYDPLNRLITKHEADNTIRYSYDGAGNRNGEDQYRVVDFTYLPEGWLLSENSRKNNGNKGHTRDYIWLGNIPLAQLHTHYNRKGTVKRQSLYYLHTDHLNTPRMATDAQQNVVWRWDSDAFGATKADRDPDGDGKKVAINLRFPGQYYDRENGLYYNHFRDYDAEIGRYVQSDPIGLRGGLNNYAYALANPLQYSDPRGLAVTPETIWDASNVVIGASDTIRALRNGDYGEVIISGLCTGLDAVATALPFVPAGASAARRVLQTGGHKIHNRVANSLNDYFSKSYTKRDWGRALEDLKKSNGLRNDHHGKIMGNGDYINDTGHLIDNLGDYLP